MINNFFDFIGFNDPFVHKIHEKYGIFSAKLWNISNVAFRISLFNLIIGIIVLLYYLFSTSEIILNIGVIFLFIAQFLFWIGQLAIIIYQILRKDYLWAVGSFFFFVFIFLYKYLKKREF